MDCEKGGYGSLDPVQPIAPPKRRFGWRHALSIPVACLALVQLHQTWFTFTASYDNGIAWSSCPDIPEQHCAFLTVPLDYTNPRPNETVSLSLRKLPATAPVKDRKGALLVNPGGPGGSGAAFVIRGGLLISTILQGKYDIIGFDPRGVNLTSPALHCFDNEGDNFRFGKDVQELGLPVQARGSSGNDTEAELALLTRIGTYSEALSEACYENGNRLIQRATSTAFVGATFSAMFPEKVGRVVLDGVSDSVAYTNNLIEWGRSGMHDTQKTYDGFLSSCAAAGPERCAFAKSGSTAQDLEKRVKKLETRLLASPLPVARSKFGPGIVTLSDFRQAIFQALYKPAAWPILAEAIAGAERGDGRPLYEFTNSANDQLDRHVPKSPFHRPLTGSIASTFAIMCTDTNTTVFDDWKIEDYQHYYRELSSISPTGDIWANWMTHCSRWRSKAIEAYRGPWTRKDGLKKTAFPVLFVSNTADPVTPLMAAESMSRGFGNDSASLLISRGYGHCSSSHPSTKVSKAIRAYFLDGEVPEYGTTYDADPGFLFPETKPTTMTESNVSIEDAGLQQALHQLADLMPSYGLNPRLHH